jgi:hypothetical protein
MKIKIEYDYWGRMYRAFCRVDGTVEFGLSDVSFEEAKGKVLETLRQQKTETPPEPEEVEL